MRKKTQEEFLKSFGANYEFAKKIYNLEVEKASTYEEWKIVHGVEKQKRLLNAGSSLFSMNLYLFAAIAGVNVKPFSPLDFIFASYLIYRTIDFTFKASKLMRKIIKINKIILKLVKNDFRSNIILTNIKEYLDQ